MKLTSKKALKYDPNVFIVEILGTKIEQLGNITTYCVQNSILFNVEREGLFHRSMAFYITLRCTSEQLTEIILHFG